MKRVTGTLAGVLLTVALGCSRGYDRNRDGPLEVSDAWVRVTAVTATAAMYGTFTNHDDVAVQLLSVSTPDAASAELHETMQMNGMSHMHHLDSVPVPAKGVLTLAPGGMHVMLSAVARALPAGDSVTLTFRLSGGGTTSVRAVVRAP